MMHRFSLSLVVGCAVALVAFSPQPLRAQGEEGAPDARSDAAFSNQVSQQRRVLSQKVSKAQGEIRKVDRELASQARAKKRTLSAARERLQGIGKGPETTESPREAELQQRKTELQAEIAEAQGEWAALEGEARSRYGKLPGWWRPLPGGSSTTVVSSTAPRRGDGSTEASASDTADVSDGAFSSTVSRKRRSYANEISAAKREIKSIDRELAAVAKKRKRALDGARKRFQGVGAGPTDAKSEREIDLEKKKAEAQARIETARGEYAALEAEATSRNNGSRPSWWRSLD